MLLSHSLSCDSFRFSNLKQLGQKQIDESIKHDVQFHNVNLHVSDVLLSKSNYHWKWLLFSWLSWFFLVVTLPGLILYYFLDDIRQSGVCFTIVSYFYVYHDNFFRPQAKTRIFKVQIVVNRKLNLMCTMNMNIFFY